MAARRIKFCGWGWEGDVATPAEEKAVLGRIAARHGLSGFDQRPMPALEVSTANGTASTQAASSGTAQGSAPGQFRPPPHHGTG